MHGVGSKLEQPRGETGRHEWFSGGRGRSPKCSGPSGSDGMLLVVWLVHDRQGWRLIDGLQHMFFVLEQTLKLVSSDAGLVAHASESVIER
jgi:hypothetical protein